MSLVGGEWAPTPSLVRGDGGPMAEPWENSAKSTQLIYITLTLLAYILLRIVFFKGFGPSLRPFRPQRAGRALAFWPTPLSPVRLPSTLSLVGGSGSSCHLLAFFCLGGQDAQVLPENLHLQRLSATLQKENPSSHCALCGLRVPTEPGDGDLSAAFRCLRREGCNGMR